jgi:hypothetical protein
MCVLRSSKKGPWVGVLQSGRPRSWQLQKRELIPGPKIYYQDFVYVGDQEFAEFFVVRMDQVGIAIFVGCEGQEETVGVTLG